MSNVLIPCSAASGDSATAVGTTKAATAPASHQTVAGEEAATTEPHMPTRIQLRRRSDCKKPTDAVVVSRPSVWGNPYALGTALARVPALDGTAWEHVPSGVVETSYTHHHGDGRVTTHTVRLMTLLECIALYEQALVAPTPQVRLVRGLYERRRNSQGRLERIQVGQEQLTVEHVRAELGGRDLCCWCPPEQACHADVLLRVGNPDLFPPKETRHG